MDDLLGWFKEITPGGVGIWTAVGLIIVALIRQGPINRKLTQEREGNLLQERAKEMAGMRRRIAQLEAEHRVDRHTIANLEQCLDSLLLMIELDPARAAEAAVKVRRRREADKVALAQEKAGIYAGAIAGAGLAAEPGEESEAA